MSEGFSFPEDIVAEEEGVTEAWSFEGGDSRRERFTNQVEVEHPADWAPYIEHLKRIGGGVKIELLALYSLASFQSTVAYEALYTLNYALTGGYLPVGYEYAMRLEAYLLPIWEAEDGSHFDGDRITIYNKTLHMELVTGEHFTGSYPLKSSWQDVGGEGGQQFKEKKESGEHFVTWMVEPPVNAKSFVGFKVEQVRGSQHLEGTATAPPVEGEAISFELSRSFGLRIGEEPFPGQVIAQACVPEFSESSEVLNPPPGEVNASGPRSGSRKQRHRVVGHR